MESNQDKTIPANESSNKEASLSPGTMVGDKYRIDALIGVGGMGTVYRVKQIYLEKDFALKVLDLHQKTDASVRRFHLEARTASQLQHSNLVGVHDFGMFDHKQPYLVMDLVEGVTLSEVLKQRGSLSADYVTQLCVQLSFGLLYAHGKGVVHRDIKPGNIMLLHPDRDVTEGTVKIVDFGIAKLTQSEDGEIQTLTKTGEIFGSPIYMSPEQCKGTGVDKRSDIYSLGCVLFECLAGTPPFLGDTAMSTMMMRLSDAVPSLKEASLGREFPPVLESIVHKMLAADPADRYQDLSVVISDLMAMQRPEQGLVVSTSVKEKPKKRELTVGKKAMVLAAVALGASGVTAIVDRAFVYPNYFLPMLDGAQASSSHFASTVNAGNLERLKAKLEKTQRLPELDNPELWKNARKKRSAKMSVALASGTEVEKPDDIRDKKIPPEVTRVVQTSPLGGVYEPLEVTQFRDAQSAKEFDENVGRRMEVRRATGVPTIETRTSSTGDRQAFVVFPDNYGWFYFDGLKPKAKGPILLPPDKRIDLFRLNAQAAINLETFRNLTGLNFKRIEFPESRLVGDREIAILKKIPLVQEVGLECTNVTSLNSLYSSTALNKLYLAGTRVPTSEIKKVTRLRELRELTFGPVQDPETIFNTLAGSTSLHSLTYRGAIGNSDKGTGLEPYQVDALSKMTHLTRVVIQVCPTFDDASLKKLVALKELREIKISDCGLTPACVSTFRQFKKLRRVELPTRSWPPDVVTALRRDFWFDEIVSRKERNEERAEQSEHTAKFLN